jgi:hypothetical protein
LGSGSLAGPLSRAVAWLLLRSCRHALLRDLSADLGVQLPILRQVRKQVTFDRQLSVPLSLATAIWPVSRRIKQPPPTGPGYQRSQTMRTGERRRREGPSERRPQLRTWHREFLTTKSLRQSPELTQRHKGLGPFRPSRLEQVSPSCACMQDEAGRKSARVAAVELRAPKRRCSRLRWTTAWFPAAAASAAAPRAPNRTSNAGPTRTNTMTSAATASDHRTLMTDVSMPAALHLITANASCIA